MHLIACTPSSPKSHLYQLFLAALRDSLSELSEVLSPSPHFTPIKLNLQISHCTFFLSQQIRSFFSLCFLEYSHKKKAKLKNKLKKNLGLCYSINVQLDQKLKFTFHGFWLYPVGLFFVCLLSRITHLLARCLQGPIGSGERKGYVSGNAISLVFAIKTPTQSDWRQKSVGGSDEP